MSRGTYKIVSIGNKNSEIPGEKNVAAFEICKRFQEGCRYKGVYGDNLQ